MEDHSVLEWCGHSRTIQTGSGKLRIYFPGGTNAIVGQVVGFGVGSVEVANSTIGICNLNFDVRG